MNTRMTTFRIALAAASFFSALGISAAPLNITVSTEQDGTTPAVLAYNVGHFMPGSNAADWWRYTGANGARVFITPSVGDAAANNPGEVASLEAFNARRAAVRANAANPNQQINYANINLPYFEKKYRANVMSGNRFVVAPLFTELRKQGVDILINLTASKGTFPLVDSNDWSGKWRLWVYYYTQAFYFGRDYDVRKYGTFNEPNLATITVAEWQERLELASDALQCALADVNARYGKNLEPQIFATNQAGAASFNEWGLPAVDNRHRRYDGSIDPLWRNFHFFNFQKYVTNSSSYADDINSMRSALNARIGNEVPYDVGLTEFNSTSGSVFDETNLTADHYSQFAALGGTFITITKAKSSQMYLFKFALTLRDGTSNYPLQKNGTHYVDNDEAAGSLNPYGGATRAAEAYRLFVKAAKSSRPYYKCTGDNYNITSESTQRHILVTRDESNGYVYIYAASRNTSAADVSLNLSAFNIPEGNVYTIEEVSDTNCGGIVARGAMNASGIINYTIPGSAVTLITISTRSQAVMDTVSGSRFLEVKAVADAQLTDGALKSTPAGGAASLVVRSTGVSADGRQVTLIKIPVPAISPNDIQVALLDVFAATTSGGTWAQTHVYGLEDDNWDENTVTWANLTTALKQDVPAGNKILNNVIANQGGLTKILGQLTVGTTSSSEKMVNVTDYVRSQTDGFASFIIVQDFRWDITLGSTSPAPGQPLTPGDTQPCGISIVSREGDTGTHKGPRLLIAASAAPAAPTLTDQPRSAQVAEGTSVTLSVGLENTAGVTYQWRKDGTNIAGANSSTLTISGALADAGVYDVVVTYGGGSSITSNEAYVVVTPSATVAPDSPFTQPIGIAVDAAGHLYVSDYSRHIIQTITPNNNYLSTFAGESGVPGSRNAVGTVAQFRNPTGLAVHGGKLYVADTGNAVIRSIAADATVSNKGGGVGKHAFADGVDASARFNYPEGIAADAEGNLYVADTENHIVRKIATSGSITSYGAGAGVAGLRDGLAIEALYAMPAGVAVAGTGTNLVIYVADTGNHVIRKIANGQITTFAGVPREAGSSDGPLLSARFREPRGMVVDGEGTLYIADTGNSLIRAISGTTVRTLAGLPATDAIPGLAGYKDGKGEGAWFSNPESLALGPDGKLYVADTGNRIIRVIDLNDNVTTLAPTTKPQTQPDDEFYNHTDSGSSGGGGAPSLWMLASLGALMCYRKFRR